MLGELAQSVRAGVLYASGHRFNPCIPYHTQRGSISQSTPSSIGQSNGLLIRRLQVQLLRGVPLPTYGGSISQRGLGVVAQSVEASDLKSVQSGFESQLPYHSQRKHKSKVWWRWAESNRRPNKCLMRFCLSNHLFTPVQT